MEFVVEMTKTTHSAKTIYFSPNQLAIQILLAYLNDK